MYDVQALTQGLASLFDLSTLFWLVVGFVVGYIVGAIPGFNDANLMAILLPFTLLLDPTDAIVGMAAMYCAAQASGAIPSILVNIPGTPGTAASALEGYPLARQGKAALALGISFAGSTIGGLFGALVALLLAPVLGALALRFGPAEMFMVVVFGLSAVSSLTGEHVWKGLLSIFLGLLISLVGADGIQGYPRATFGIAELYDGLPLVPVLLGLFGFSELIFLARQPSVVNATVHAAGSFKEIMEGVKAVFRYPFALLWSSVVGTVIGITPGAGATVASFVAYAHARQWSKEPERYGKGSAEGLTATETANNAVTGGAMVPLLTLGLPGSTSTLMMLAALVLHGIRPGPRFFVDFQVEAYTILLSLLVSNLLIFVVGLPIARPFQAIAMVPTPILVPILSVLLFLGAYAYRTSPFDLILMVAFGVLGAVLRTYGYPLAALLLAIILGPMAEANFLRAVRIGGYGLLLESGISKVLLLLSVISFLAPWLGRLRKRHAQAVASPVG